MIIPEPPSLATWNLPLPRLEFWKLRLATLPAVSEIWSKPDLAL
jgi:hypothetical protein